MNTDWAWTQRLGYDADGYEQRRACFALIACPHCQATVELVAESSAWTQREDGRWQHIEYGPPLGECCGRVYMDDPFEGVRSFRLRDGT